MSLAIFEAPMIRPSTFLTGETVQRNYNRTTILAPANGFIVVNALPARNLLKDYALFILPIWRDQNCNRCADHFFGRIAKQSLRAVIPTDNEAIESLADDCVITGLGNGRKPSKPLFAFA
jgi:hypothetical protein